MMQGLAPFFEERTYRNGQPIFLRGDPPLSIYFIVTGEVTLYEFEPGSASERAETPQQGGSGPLPSAAGAKQSAPVRRLEAGFGPAEHAAAEQSGRRLVRYVNGGIFGELDFFLQHPRSFNAVATSDGCVILQLTRDALQSMQSQASQLAAALEHAVLKYLCFQVNNKLGLSDGVSDIREYVY